MRYLLDTLLDEKNHGVKGSVYHKFQVDFAYNSNHMEGSKLTHDQTKYIFDTKTVSDDNGSIPVDDIIEVINHFRAFDYILDTVMDPLSEKYIKHIHYMLKNATLSSDAEYAVVGDYKSVPNYVLDEIQTSSPKNVHSDIVKLLDKYNGAQRIGFDEIIGFHSDFEKIHPFYDGNGRVGRLIMFKECIRNDIIPFIITDDYKSYYNNGLKNWQLGREKGYLRDTCLLMQDNMILQLKYFEISTDHCFSPKSVIDKIEKNRIKIKDKDPDPPGKEQHNGER